MSPAHSPEFYVNFTLELLTQHGLPQTWHVNIVDGMGRRLGTCHYRKQLIRLNATHLRQGPHEQIMNTCRHEVAHALAHSRYGDQIKPHGPEWKATARELGATPRASVPLTDQQKALQRALNAAERAAPTTHARRTRKGPTKARPVSFYSAQLGRNIATGDQLSYQGKIFEVIETKRTRFTGRATHNGQVYSISAAVIPKSKFL